MLLSEPSESVFNLRWANRAPVLCALVTNFKWPIDDQTLVIWRWDAGGECRRIPLAPLRGNLPPVRDAIASPDASTIAIQMGTEVVLLNASSGAVQDRIDVGVRGCWEMAADEQGGTLACACSLEWPPVVTCNLRTRSVIRFFPPEDFEYSAHMPRVTMDAAGRCVAAAFNCGEALIWNAHTGELIKRLQVAPSSATQNEGMGRSWQGLFCRRLRLSANRERIAWASLPAAQTAFPRMIAGSMAIDGDPRPVFCPVSSSMSAAEFSPDLSLLACPIDEETQPIGVWEMASQRMIGRIEHPLGAVHDIRWSEDGRWLTLGGDKGIVLHPTTEFENRFEVQ
jgi:hypothetical protein